MDTNFLPLALSILLITFVFGFCFLRKVNEIWYSNIMLGTKKKHLLPPGDMGWLLFGNMWSFIRAFTSQNPDTFFHNLVNRYGRTGIYKTHLFFCPTIIVSTPETCRKVFLDDEHFKPSYPTSVMRLTGRKSIITVSKSEHKRLRQLIAAPINGPDQLSLYLGYIEDIVTHELDTLASLSRPVEFFTAMKRLTFKIIIHIFLSSDVEQSNIGSMQKYYDDFFNGFRSIAAINLPGFAFHKALKAKKMLVSTFQAILDGRRGKSCKIDGQQEKLGLMDLLLEVQDNNGEKLEDEPIIDLLIGLLLAGHETSASAAMWATLYLHDNPEILHKARVIDETLRLATLSFANFREAKAEVNINGCVIPKGWKVLVNTRGVHMDPEIHLNPQDFNPSRWDNQNPKAGSVIPFGGGSRICPGADLAKLEISIFLHYFLLNYRLEQVNPKGPVEYLPIPKPADNCLAKVIKLP